MEIAIVVAVPVLLIALGALYRWGKAQPSSKRQREMALRNYQRDVEDDDR